MKKYVFLALSLAALLSIHQAFAAEPQTSPDAAPEADSSTTAATDSSAPSAPAAPATPAAADSNASAPAADASSAPAETAQTTPAPEAKPAAAQNTENLEFVSGEITAVDQAGKTLSVKLYGETDQNTPEKTVTIKVDETTDITDGEKDRDLKSLTAGTEVDVEYDAASSKATYIFVY